MFIKCSSFVDDKYEFCILSSDHSFWKTQKNKVLAEKKSEEDVWDFLYNNICNTHIPTLVVLSRKELCEIFEKIPEGIEHCAFYLKTKGKFNSIAHSEHSEITRENLVVILQEAASDSK